METRLAIPCERNVDLGDLVAFPNEVKLIKFFPITARGSHYVVTKFNNQEKMIRYDGAIVLKKDGTILVGESVYDPNFN